MRVMNVMLGKGRGGLEAVAYQYARVFMERGHESVMVCHSKSQLKCPDGVTRVGLPGSSLFNPLNYLKLVLAVRKYCPDVVFAHAGRATNFCNAIRMFMPRYTRLVGIAHGANSKRFREMDSIIAVSESVRQELVHDWQAPEGRIRVVHNAVKVPQCLPPAQHVAKTPTIAFLGRFDRCKAVDVLFDSLAILKGRAVDFTLKIAGSGEMEGELRVKAERLGVAENVKWCGWIEDAQKNDFFSDVDVVAMPSREEAFGIVMLEAMAHGKPVVVSDCEVPARVVSTARCGLVVPKEDSKSLADALENLISAHKTRAEMGMMGHEAAKAEYSEDRMGDILEDIVLHCDVSRKRSLTPGRFRVLALMLADSACLFATWAVLVCGYKLLGFGDYNAHVYFRLWPVLPIFIGINMICRLYHGNWMYPAMPLSPVEEFRRLFASSVFTHLLLMSVLGFTRHNADYSRFIIGAGGMLVGFFAQSFRNVVRHLLFKLHICQIPVALAGSGETAKRVEAILGDSTYIGFDIVLKFDEKSLRDIVPRSQKLDVKILLACQDERFFRAQLRDFSGWFNYIEYLPRMEVFPVLGSHAVSLDSFGGLEMMNQGRMKALRWEKRILDCALAIIGLTFALPFFAIVPILVKLTSKGPVFYRQERLGKLGRPFRIWKFRTMYADADRRLEALLDSDPALKAEFTENFKLRNDPRVTPLGKFLRKTSLDEIPQLLNVFAGEMSFIGPRPIVAAEVKYYGADYETISRVRPGVTGLWQCSGRSDTDYPRRVVLDVYYVLNWSPWMDIWICIRTAFRVLAMKGAV